MTKKSVYRQGDVLIRQVVKAAGTKPIEREGGKVVLAHGEVTGHSHAIAAKEAHFALNEQTQARYLTLDKASFLRHEEHSEIQLPAGDYEIVIQREYRYGSSRAVLD